MMWEKHGRHGVIPELMHWRLWMDSNTGCWRSLARDGFDMLGTRDFVCVDLMSWT